MASKNSHASYLSKTNPLPRVVSGSNPVIVSASPPVLRTTGIVPYLSDIIWLSPHGSYLDGIRKISAPEYILLARSSSNLRFIDALCGTLLLIRSEEHTSEIQSQSNLVCRLLL